MQQEAQIHTKRLGENDNLTSWTWVYFTHPPTGRHVTAGLRATDGDYNLHDCTLLIYHRAIPTEQRTRNIAMCLKNAGVSVIAVAHHGRMLKTEIGLGGATPENIAQKSEIRN